MAKTGTLCGENLKKIKTGKVGKVCDENSKC